MTRKRAELLLPAGSLEKLKIALLYGADAVYMGTPDMSLRTRSKFTLEEVVEGIAFAHAQGKKVYLTLNLFSHNRDIEKLSHYLDVIRKVKPDGVIVADPGVFNFVKTNAPELEIHISTQANVCSHLSVQFWKSLGARLVVLAREVSFAELKKIREKCPDIKLEAFIHGAMCMTYSGRCLLSNFLAERGANQGNCANSCRWHYKIRMKLKDGTLKEIELNEETRELFEFFLEEEERPGELLPIEEDERGSYILNSKDLCIMPRLNDYLAAGVDSLKIEGRNRSAYYVATTARAYRHAVDAWYENPESWDAGVYMRELETIPNRGYTLAFHEGSLTHHAHNYEDTHTLAAWEFAGMIREVSDDAFFLDVKNRIQHGDVLEFLSPMAPMAPMASMARGPMRLRIYEFDDVHNNKKNTKEIHAGQKPLLKIPFAWFHQEDQTRFKQDFPELTVVRKKCILSDEEEARLKMDHASQKVECGCGKEEKYIRERDAFKAAHDAAPLTKEPRVPHLGAEGCCGRGCNGCLHFWHDERYEKARQLLSQKKQGELLTGEEAKLSLDVPQDKKPSGGGSGKG